MDRWLVVLAVVLAACASPRYTPVRVQMLGPTGDAPVDPIAVEVLRARDARRFEPIATLEIDADGSTFDDLVHRLRVRAARLGADALVDVVAVYDAAGPTNRRTTSDDAPTFLDGARDAATAGLSLALTRPRWRSVKGTAVRRLASIPASRPAVTAATP